MRPSRLHAQAGRLRHKICGGGASHFLKGVDGSFTGQPVGGSYRRLWWQALKDLSTVLIDLGRAVSKKRLLLRGTEHQKWMLLTPED